MDLNAVLTILATVFALGQVVFGFQTLRRAQQQRWQNLAAAVLPPALVVGTLLLGYFHVVSVTWPVAIVVVILAVLLQRLEPWPRATPVSQDALVVQDDQLRGRDLQCQEFVDQYLKPHDLVFIFGRAGVGKTWFATRALVRLLDDPRSALSPLIVDLRGLDWERAPLQLLAQALSRELRGQWKSPVTDRDFAKAFDTLLERGRKAVVVCDQFDDYFHAHSDRLVHRGQTMPYEQLVAENRFWRVLHEGLQASRLKLLVIAQDRLSQLESVRFGRNAAFQLRGLDEHSARNVVDSVLEKASPEGDPAVLAGLEDALLADLLASNDQLVLPVELRVALLSLSTLSELSPGAYRRAGRLNGLKIAWISRVIDQGRGALSAETLVQALRCLIRDPGSSQATTLLTKTIEAIVSELRASGVTVAPEALAIAFESLQRADVVRARNEGGEVAWELDHEYLAEPIGAFQEAQDRVTRLLRERRRLFTRGSRDRHTRSAALLGVSELCAVAGARLRGRVRFDRADRRLLLASLRGLGVIPWGLVTLLVVFIGLTAMSAGRAHRRDGLAAALASTDAEVRTRAVWGMVTWPRPVLTSVGLRTLPVVTPPIPLFQSLTLAARGVDPTNESAADDVLRGFCFQASYQSSGHFASCAQLVALSQRPTPEALRFLGTAQTAGDWRAAGSALLSLPRRPEAASELRPRLWAGLDTVLKEPPSPDMVSATSILGVLIAREEGRDGQARLADRLLMEPNVHHGMAAAAVLGALEDVPVLLETPAHVERFGNLVRLAVTGALKARPLADGLPDLHARLGEAHRLALVADIEQRFATAAAEDAARRDAFVLILGAGVPRAVTAALGRIADACVEDAKSGDAHACLRRLPARPVCETCVDAPTMKRWTTMAREWIARAPVGIDWAAVNSPWRQRRSGLMPIVTTLPESERRALAGALLPAITAQHDASRSVWVAANAMDVVATYAAPDVFASMCDAVDRALEKSERANERAILLHAFSKCGQSDRRWTVRATELHYPKQRTLLLESLDPSQRDALTVGLTQVTSMLPMAVAGAEFKWWRRQLLEQRRNVTCQVFNGFGQAEPRATMEVLRWPICHGPIGLQRLAFTMLPPAQRAQAWQGPSGAEWFDLAAFAAWARREQLDVGPLASVPPEVEARARVPRWK